MLVGGLSLVLRGGLVNFWGSGLIFWFPWAVSGVTIGLGGLVSGSVVTGPGFCTRLLGCFSGLL